MGITVFHSIAEAIHYGFEVYDKTAEGWLVRTKTSKGFALALVIENK